MPTKPMFLRWWQRLEERFGKRPGADSYYAYLHRVLPRDEEFEPAAAAVWATARFFPRPADFMLVSAAAAWLAVCDHVPRMKKAGVEDWQRHRDQIPTSGWAALAHLGGPQSFYAATDVVAFRRSFLHAYEQVITLQAQIILPALPGPSDRSAT